MSALLSSATGSVLSTGHTVIPTLAVTETCRPPTWNGSWKAADDAARHRLDLERTFDVLEQHGELVAAESSEQVAFANAACEPLHDRAQQHVAGLVAERLVHDLEPVEIEQQQRHVLRARNARCRRAVELVAQVLPVRNAGQRVVDARGS